MNLNDMSDAELMSALGTQPPNPFAQQLQPYLNHPNVRNYLDLISKSEGTDKNGYQTAFGGGLIENLNDHPRQLYDFTQTNGLKNKTSAAGRYQFIQPTWDDVAGKLGLKDFGPESQDLGAIELMRRDGSLNDVLNGDYHAAVKKSGNTWASLPSSPYAQPKRSAGFIEGIVNSMIPTAQAQSLPDYSKLSNEDLMAQLGMQQPESVQNQANNDLSSINDADLMKMLGIKKNTQANPTDGSVSAGIWRGISDPIDAMAQMLRRAMPDRVGNAVDAFGNKLADMGVPIARSNGVHGLDALINNANQKYDEGRKAAGRSGFDFARLGGNIVSSAPLMAATGGGGATSLLPQIGKGAITGGLFGLMNPVVGEQNQANFTNEKLKQAAVGSAFGAATPVVTNGIARLISPQASVDPYVKLLQKEGVELTPGQALGGAFAKTEDKLMSMPILGDAISASRSRGNDQLNRAVYNRVLDPIGGSTAKVGRDAVDDVSRQVSNAYDEVLSKVTFTPDNAFTQQLAKLRNMATNGLPQKEAEQFAKELERNVIGPLSKGKSIDGQAFKDIETQLGNRASAFLKSNDVYQQDLGNALIQVQKSMRDNLMRLNPSAAQDLQSVNQSFANLTRLQNAAGKINAENGVFTPAQLSQAVRQGDRTVRKNAYAKGDALMQDLSDAARSVMMNRVPNSGTVDRLAINAGALGSGLWNPYIPAALAGASIPYLPHVQKLATGAIVNRPDTARMLAEQLKKIPAGIGGLLINNM